MNQIFSKFTFSGLILCIISLFLISIISFFVLYFESGQENRQSDEINRESYRYKYLRIDSISNTTKKGIVSIPHEIIPLSEEGVESVTYEPSIGVHILFSKFGSDVYYCTGSCYCIENEKERRLSSTSVPVVRGLLYLVSSLTSVLAIKKAEEYFSNECVLGLEEECPLNSIHSTVDDCNPINFILVDSKPADEVDTNTKEPESTDFMCTGACSSLINFLSKFGVIRKKVVKDMLHLHSTLTSEEELDRVLASLKNYFYEEKAGMMVYCNNLELTSKVTVERKGSFDAQEMNAINNFCDIQLHKYCKSNSYFTHDEMIQRFSGKQQARGDPRALEIWKESHKLYSEEDSHAEGMNICKSSKSTSLISLSEQKTADNTQIRIGQNKLVGIVCLRIFTDEEWKDGIPYESENLRHWKEGHKMKPDRITEEMAFRNVQGEILISQDMEKQKRSKHS